MVLLVFTRMQDVANNLRADFEAIVITRRDLKKYYFPVEIFHLYLSAKFWENEQGCQVPPVENTPTFVPK